MKKIGIYLLAIAMFAFAVAGVSAIGGMRFAAGSDFSAIHDAIVNKDFSAWKDLMAARLTQDNFNKIVDRQQRIQAMNDTRTEIDAAIQSGDYTSWLALVNNTPQGNKLSGIITAENFSKFGEMHKAMKSKDFATAKKIAEELGLPDGNGRMGQGKMGKGFNKGWHMRGGN